MTKRSRREVLAAGGLLVGSVLAGCIDQSGQGTEPPTSSPTETPATEDGAGTPTPTPEGSTPTTVDEPTTEPGTDEPPTEPPTDRPTQEGVAWRYDLGASIEHAPALGDGTVYVGGWRETYGTPTPDDYGRSNALVALDADTGGRDWEYDAGAPIQAAPRAVGDTVYLIRGFNGLHGNGYQVRGLASDGTERWVHEAPPLKFLQVLGADEHGLCVGTHDDALGTGGNERLTALSPESGVDWHHDFGDVNDGTITGDTVYATDYVGRLRAVDRESGEERWTYEAEGMYLDGPALTDEVVVTGDGAAVALEQAGGDLRWEFDGVGVQQVTAAEGYAFVVDSEGRLHALDAADGSEQWTVRTGPRPELAVADGTLYVLRSSGRASAHALDDGSADWEVDLGGGGTLVPAGDHVYALVGTGNGGKAMALAAADGSRDLTVDLDGPPVGIAAANGRAVAASETGTVYGLSNL